ncbi:Voltage-dependent anion-selective channel protein 2, partial [Blattella germanica]
IVSLLAGLTFSEKWNTDNTLGTEIAIQDKPTKGLKASYDCTFAPHTGSKTGRVKGEFKNDVCAINLDVDLDLNGPIALGSAVFGYNGEKNDGQDFGGSIYQKVSPKLETAIDINWSAGSNETRFGIGAKFDLEKGGVIRGKVNNLSQVGLGYQQKLHDGVTVYLSALIDGKNFNQGGHKLGVGLELEA